MEDAGDAFIPSSSKPAGLLPIAKHKEQLLYTIEEFPVTVVIGQTGSGKTTQLPQYLEQGGWCSDGKVIAVTQVGELCAIPAICKSDLIPSTAKESRRDVCGNKGCRGDRLSDR